MNEELMSPAQSEEYQDYIVRYNQNINSPIEYVSDGTFQIINEFFAVLYVPSISVPDIEINTYSYNSIPNCYTYMDYEALQASGITSLQEHPYLKLQGEGTLIAVIDSGIDYMNRLFREGDRSRILAIWDQTMDGERTELVPFGKVFFQKDIHAAMQSENPMEYVASVDENGHGTILAALAAGGRNIQENFSGAAPKASILVVKLKQAKKYLRKFYLYPENRDLFQEDDIMLGISFALKCAKSFQLPLSICLGVGSNQGAHLGRSPLCQYIDYISGFAQNVVSIAAGNEGMARHHYKGTLSQIKNEESVELKIGGEEYGFSMEFWGNSIELYGITIQSPTGERLEISTSIQSSTQTLSFVFVETKVLVNYVNIERMTGNTLVYFRFLNPASGIWTFWISGKRGENSQYHMWLPVQGLISEETYFLQSSPYETITTPGDAKEGMTVTAYDAADGSFFYQSSRGFLPDGTVKPTFSAPGVNVTVPFMNDIWGKGTGTSLAAAQNAGIAALLFEWALIRGNSPFFNGNNVKSYLQRGTRKGNTLQYPNPEQGYGKIELYRSFELLS